MNTALTVALVVMTVACGGAAKQDGTEPLDVARDSQKHEVHPGAAGSGAEHHEMGPKGEHGEMAKLPAPVAKFHDTLAPRWHAEHGPKRTADTCAAIGELRSGADAIAAAPAPAGANPAAWSAGGAQLTEAVAALDATCKARDAVAFEPAFERVHTSFHHVMEAGSAHAEH